MWTTGSTEYDLAIIEQRQLERRLAANSWRYSEPARTANSFRGQVAGLLRSAADHLAPAPQTSPAPAMRRARA